MNTLFTFVYRTTPTSSTPFRLSHARGPLARKAKRPGKSLVLQFMDILHLLLVVLSTLSVGIRVEKSDI